MAAGTQPHGQGAGFLGRLGFLWGSARLPGHGPCPQFVAILRGFALANRWNRADLLAHGSLTIPCRGLVVACLCSDPPGFSLAFGSL